MKKKMLIIALTIIAVLLVPINIGVDYWVWLGYPSPIGMLLIDNDPGHDLTAKYRHENYFVKIPETYLSYKKVVLAFGQPLEVVTFENLADNSIIRIKAIYDDFYIDYAGYNNEILDDYTISYITITSGNLFFTRDKIKIGDSRDRIEHCYRYYSKIKETELINGYTEGYIDGSMLTGQTWVQFEFDENDCVKSIKIYCPW